jgi:hypothetical protein
VTRTVDYYFRIGSPWPDLGHARVVEPNQGRLDFVDRRLAR